MKFYLEKLTAEELATGREPRIVVSGRRGMYVFLDRVSEYLSPRHALQNCVAYLKKSQDGKFMRKPYSRSVTQLPAAFFQK